LVGPEGLGYGAAVLAWQGGVPLLRGGIIDRAGFTTFLARDDTVGVVAAGIPAEESNLRLQAVSDWRNKLQSNGLEILADLTDQAPAEFMAALGGHDAAPWMLALALLILMVEIQLGRGTRTVRS
jgi:hypothetical protein